jgi:hypothetical protein
MIGRMLKHSGRGSGLGQTPLGELARTTLLQKNGEHPRCYTGS